MRVTLDNFEIAGGYDRTLSILSEGRLEITQQTQVATLSRDTAPTGFHSRAVRSVPLNYSVVFPPCVTLEDALMQSRLVPLQCPKGGVLVEEHSGVRVTYAQAWVTVIRVERTGVTNRFIFSLVATRPDITTPSLLALMDSRYIANLSVITGLTGGGASKIDGLVTTDVAVGFTAFVTPTLGGFAQPKHMRLIADPDPGVTVTNADPSAGTLIVLPADYDDTTNAKIWTEL